MLPGLMLAKGAFPAHGVTISTPFDIGVCEVTQGQFGAVMDAYATRAAFFKLAQRMASAEAVAGPLIEKCTVGTYRIIRGGRERHRAGAFAPPGRGLMATEGTTRRGVSRSASR